MLKNENIVCISTIDWDFIWQGHQEIMATFAKNDNRVLFIENTGVRAPTFKDVSRLKKRLVHWIKSIKGFRKEAKSLFIYSPVVLPFPYSRFARWINKHLLVSALQRWMKAAEFHNPIIWTFLPTGTALDIIDNIENKLIVYYCIADFYELVAKPKKIKRTEDELISKADLIFAQGEVLARHCKRLNDNVHIFPFGVNVEVFEARVAEVKIIPEDIKTIKKPIIGYIGGIHRHIDFKLINFLAGSHPECSIVLIGPIQTDVSPITKLGSVFLLGQKEFLSLPNYMSEFDVGIIPYEINEYTRTVFPTKLNEYHAVGMPVVSTDLPEVREFNLKNENLVLIARTYQEFSENILSALSDKNEGLRNKRRASAEKNNWICRIEGMSELIKNKIEEKVSNHVDWQSKFIRLYKIARKNIISAVALFLFAYSLIFYTPLIWLIAEPLKISQNPEKADGIVVLAGGVGESGKAGQGYEERVKYAVDLYKSGFAGNLVFSSGYKYVFEEPLLMRALAISLGVPPEVIALDDKAVNTYENVKFVKEIIKEKKWQKILLVSSPYHMRRLWFVVRKHMPEIEVIYTPIMDSHFYSHSGSNDGKKTLKQITSRQISAIMHEYISVLYYKLKGFI